MSELEPGAFRGPLAVQTAHDDSEDCAIVATVDGKKYILGEVYYRVGATDNSQQYVYADAEANARLWSLAPQMEEALRAMWETRFDAVTEPELLEAWQKARDVLARLDEE